MPAPFFLCKKSCLAVPNNGCLWNSGFIGGHSTAKRAMQNTHCGSLVERLWWENNATKCMIFLKSQNSPTKIWANIFPRWFPTTLFETYWQCLFETYRPPQKNCCLEVGILHPIKFHIVDPFHTQIFGSAMRKKKPVTKGSGRWLKRNKTKGATANLSSICSVNHDLQLLGSSICSSTAKIKHDLFLFISASANRKSRKILLYTVWLA